MTNRYPVKCIQCGYLCEPYEARVTWSNGRHKWIGLCPGCWRDYQEYYEQEKERKVQSETHSRSIS